METDSKPLWALVEFNEQKLITKETHNHKEVYTKPVKYNSMKSRFSTDVYFHFTRVGIQLVFQVVTEHLPRDPPERCAPCSSPPFSRLYLASDSPPSPRHPGVWPSDHQMMAAGCRSGPGRSKG